MSAALPAGGGGADGAALIPPDALPGVLAGRCGPGGAWVLAQLDRAPSAADAWRLELREADFALIGYRRGEVCEQIEQDYEVVRCAPCRPLAS